VGACAATLLAEHAPAAGRVRATSSNRALVELADDMHFVIGRWTPHRPMLPIEISIASEADLPTCGVDVFVDRSALIIGGLRIPIVRWIDMSSAVGPFVRGRSMELAEFVAATSGDHLDAALRAALADRGMAAGAWPWQSRSSAFRLVDVEGLQADGAGPWSARTGLLGAGGGSTPAGDDLLAGMLSAAIASGAHVPSPALRFDTSALSASLLRAAGAGAAVEPARALLVALQHDRDPIARAQALMTVGHSSGWHLVAGIAIASVIVGTDSQNTERLP
jgi:hypothetical protein